jgi:uncharacterized OsmC-like protein
VSGERVTVRQNAQSATEFLALDPRRADSPALVPVERLEELTPYGMILAGLGACTAVVLRVYAKRHDLRLDRVELRLRYDRVFAKDCETCDTVERYRETIDEEISLEGDLDAEERRRLLFVSKHCPIHKILASGVEIASRLDGSEDPSGRPAP